MDNSLDRFICYASGFFLTEYLPRERVYLGEGIEDFISDNITEAYEYHTPSQVYEMIVDMAQSLKRDLSFNYEVNDYGY